jgi:hypothetical protein
MTNIPQGGSAIVMAYYYQVEPCLNPGFWTGGGYTASMGSSAGGWKVSGTVIGQVPGIPVPVTVTVPSDAPLGESYVSICSTGTNTFRYNAQFTIVGASQPQPPVGPGPPVHCG